MRLYETSGPTRFAHQKAGLRRLISTRGVCALLFDPGMGKTAVVIDYAGLLALKSPREEARVLVICPLVAVDTWVIQIEKFLSPQVHYWAEALGGSLKERAEALAARGGEPFARSLTGKSYPRRRCHARALHSDKSLAWGSRRGPNADEPRMTPTEGPDGVRTPRLVLEVINIDTLASRSAVGSRTMADVMIDAIRRFDPDLVVVDESHKIKSAQGNASRVLGRLSKYVPRRVLLTGTVMPHSPLDVFGQWRFLEPTAFGKKEADGTYSTATFGAFKERFAVLGGWMGKEIKGFVNLDEMQSIMSRNSVVARKADALDLPPTLDSEVSVELSPAETKAYQDMKDQLAIQLANGSLASVPNRLAQMMRLRQITSGHVPDDVTGMTITLGTSKVKTIASLVHDTLVGEKRIVVFALFTHEIQMLEKALAKDGTTVFVISGSTPQEDRVRMRYVFGSDSPERIVLIAQIKTMSLAVNELVTASHAIFASMSMQRDDYVQARDRLDRIGQTQPVTFWHAIVPGTVDSVILQSHRDRTDLETAMLKHIAEQGDQGGETAWRSIGQAIAR